MIDRIKEIIPGDKALGIKCWSLDNEIFQDHFPGFSTTPGVLMTESMAQLSGSSLFFGFKMFSNIFFKSNDAKIMKPFDSYKTFIPYFDISYM